MNYKKRADIIAWMHFVWILFGIISLPLLFVIPWWDKVTLLFIGMTVMSWLFFRGCWFLQLENRFREQYDPRESFEEEAFIQHYLKKFLNVHISRLTVRIVIYTYIFCLIIVALRQIF